MPEIRTEYFPLKEETEAIIHFGFEVHNTLGFGFLEIVYKDALEDFIVFNSVILEVKAKEGIAPDDMARMINYLKCSGCKVGLILNFGRNKLEIKRMVF